MSMKIVCGVITVFRNRPAEDSRPGRRFCCSRIEKATGHWTARWRLVRPVPSSGWRLFQKYTLNLIRIYLVVCIHLYIHLFYIYLGVCRVCRTDAAGATIFAVQDE